MPDPPIRRARRRNARYNAAIRPEESVSLGYLVTGSSTPTAFWLNGQACQVG